MVTNFYRRIIIPFLILVLSFFSFVLYSQEFDSQFSETVLPSPNKLKYEEQIKCLPTDCRIILYDKEKKYQDEVWDDLGKNGGKLVIDFSDSFGFPLQSEELEDSVELLREISKRKGHISFEPLYIASRSLGEVEVPILKDIYGVSSNIYKRLRSLLKFGRMENYNAKVLFHPNTGKIFYIYFFHKNYGHLCDTVYSSCDTLEYMDDELFDRQLSLKMEQVLTKNLEIRFSKERAVLPNFRLDIQNLVDTDKSARLYKWLIATKKAETKKVSRERFLTLGLAIQILDYSLTALEIVEAVQLYSPARSKEAEIIYEETDSGKVIQSVIFSPHIEKLQ